MELFGQRLELLQLHNLGTGASLVNARTVDVLIFIPLIPAIPVIATWFLPWERWIPKKIFNRIIGPYLLYGAFAVWHFGYSWWSTLTLGLMGVGVCTAVIFDLKKARMLKLARERKARILELARDWPVAEGFLIRIGRCNWSPEVAPQLIIQSA